MVTSGAAWLLSLGFNITNPETSLNLDWNPGSILLSKPALIFDGISIPLALSLAGITSDCLDFYIGWYLLFDGSFG